MTALEVCKIISALNYDRNYEGAYSIVHERCADIVCNILDPQLPVRRTSTCLSVGGNDDRGSKWGAVAFSAAIGVRVLNHQAANVSHKVKIL